MIVTGTLCDPIPPASNSFKANPSSPSGTTAPPIEIVGFAALLNAPTPALFQAFGQALNNLNFDLQLQHTSRILLLPFQLCYDKTQLPCFQQF